MGIHGGQGVAMIGSGDLTTQGIGGPRMGVPNNETEGRKKRRRLWERIDLVIALSLGPLVISQKASRIWRHEIYTLKARMCAFIYSLK